MERRFILVAHADVHSQMCVDVPVVLQIGEVAAVDIFVQRIARVARGEVSSAQEIIGKRVAAITPVEAELPPVGRCILPIEGRNSIEFKAGFKSMSVASPCQIIGDLIVGLTVARARLIVEATESEDGLIWQL